jgi:hypothetical protein
MEKYLIILIIIITTIVCYCTVCDKNETKENKKTKESFTNADPNNNIDYNNAVFTLAAIAKDLQNPSGLIVPGNLNLKNKHVLVAEDGFLKLKTPDLNSNSNLNVKDLQVDGVSNLTPKGGIIAWKPLPANVVNGVVIPPPTWALCDGQNGTPDLRGRFILGNGQGAGLTNRLEGATGGAETVTLTEAQMPAHNHYFADNAPSGYGHWGDHGTKRPGILTWQYIASNTHNKGGNQPHENMPPFYVLAYIMKL